MKHLITFLALMAIMLCGNWTTATAQDTEPPIIPNKTVTAKTLNNGKTYLPHRTVQIDWTAAMDGITTPEKLRYTIYFKKKTQASWTSANVVTGTTTFIRNPLEAGTEYDILVTVRDQANNEAEYNITSIRTAKEDLAPPVISDKTISFEAGPYGSDKAYIKVKIKPATDDVTDMNKLNYKLDLTPRKYGSGSYTIRTGTLNTMKNWGDGTYGWEVDDLPILTEYNVSVRVMDELENWDYYTSIYYTIPDAQDPVIGDVTLTTSAIGADRFTISWQKAVDVYTPQAQLRYQVIYQIYGTNPIKSPMLTNASTYTITGLQAATDYIVWVEVYDLNDNYANYSTTYVRTSAGKPAVVTDPAAYISGTGATLYGWVSSNRGSAVTKHEFAYRKKDVGSFTTLTGQGGDGGFIYDIKGLTPETEYEFYASATNAQGTSNGETRTFKTTSATTSDDEKPTLSNSVVSASNITHNSITLSWTKATDNETPANQLRYHVLWVSNTKLDAVVDLIDISGYTITGLEAGTIYNILVAVADEKGNIKYYDNLNGVTTLTDGEAPTVSNKTITIGTVTPNSIDISWTKATDNVTAQENITYYIYCIQSTDLSELSTVGKGGVFSTIGDNSYTLTQYERFRKVYNMTPDTDYVIRVVAVDETGNYTRYNAVAAHTAAEVVPDTEGPVPSGSLSFSGISTSEITVSWTKATDNITEQAAIEYNLYWTNDDGTISAATITGGNTYTATGLDPDTEYTFTLQANDEAGNTNATHEGWTGKKARTLDPGDITAPTLANADVTIGTTTPNSIALSWTKATDDVTAANKLSYNILWYPEGDISDLDDITGQIDIISYTITGLKAETKYIIQVSVSDEAGNTTSYNSATGTTTKAPTVVNVTGITLNKTTLSLEEGASETLTATIAPKDATNKDVTWKSSNTTVATVNALGKVSAVKAGNTTITVTTVDGSKTATCAVSVIDPKVSVEQVDNEEVKVYIIGDILYVSSPKTEHIDLCNIAGLCLRSIEKPNGEVQLETGGIPRGVLIIRGSSGWVKKIMR